MRCIQISTTLYIPPPPSLPTTYTTLNCTAWNWNFVRAAGIVIASRVNILACSLISNLKVFHFKQRPSIMTIYVKGKCTESDEDIAHNLSTTLILVIKHSANKRCLNYYTA